MTQNLGLYVHYPFCKKICPYCDFNVYSSSINVSEDVILKAYTRDLEYFANRSSIKRLKTIYFGGGTPSLMSPSLMGRILEQVNNFFEVDKFAEISIEANPLDVIESKFVEFRHLGINRVSLGVQSLKDRNLAFLGREHNAKDALRAIEIVKKHFQNSTFDMIYALPNQNLQQWENELRHAISITSTHLSLYVLTIEDGTPFHRLVSSGAMRPKSSDEVADFIECTWDLMASGGFAQYEVSNFAKDLKFQSAHNKIYWHSHDYIGIGAGASGRVFCQNNIRYETVIQKSLSKWIAGTTKDLVFLQTNNEISKVEQARDIIIAGLRSFEPIIFDDIRARFNCDLKTYINMDALPALQQEMFINFDQNSIQITKKGMLFLNKVYYQILF